MNSEIFKTTEEQDDGWQVADPLIEAKHTNSIHKKCLGQLASEQT